MPYMPKLWQVASAHGTIGLVDLGYAAAGRNQETGAHYFIDTCSANPHRPATVSSRWV